MVLIVVGLLLVVFHVVSATWGIALVAGAFVLEIAEKGFWLRYTRRIPVSTGAEAMVGREVTVISACRPVGRVRFGYESWKALCTDGAGVGERLVIENVGTTKLVVGRAS